MTPSHDEIETEVRALEALASRATDKRTRGEVRRRMNALARRVPHDLVIADDLEQRLGRLRLAFG